MIYTPFMLEKALREDHLIKVDLDYDQLVTTTARNFSNFPISEKDSAKIISLFNCWYFDLKNGNVDTVEDWLKDLNAIYANYLKYGLVTTISSSESVGMLKFRYGKKVEESISAEKLQDFDICITEEMAKIIDTAPEFIPTQRNIELSKAFVEAGMGEVIVLEDEEPEVQVFSNSPIKITTKKDVKPNLPKKQNKSSK